MIYVLGSRREREKKKAEGFFWSNLALLLSRLLVQAKYSEKVLYQKHGTGLARRCDLFKERAIRQAITNFNCKKTGVHTNIVMLVAVVVVTFTVQVASQDSWNLFPNVYVFLSWQDHLRDEGGKRLPNSRVLENLLQGMLSLDPQKRLLPTLVFKKEKNSNLILIWN